MTFFDTFSTWTSGAGRVLGQASDLFGQIAQIKGSFDQLIGGGGIGGGSSGWDLGGILQQEPWATWNMGMPPQPQGPSTFLVDKPPASSGAPLVIGGVLIALLL